LIEHGLTQYRLYGRRILQVWWPNQQCQRTGGGWWLVSHPDRPRSSHAQLLTSPCFNNTTCMQI